MENVHLSFVENGMLKIRGVKVEMIATPSQTWDVTICGTVYHITLEQEAALLDTVLFHGYKPSPKKIASLNYSGERKKVPSPALMDYIVKSCHQCIDLTTNVRKSCSEVFDLKGYGYMNKWQAFCYCLPYAFAIYFWFAIAMLMWNVVEWLFCISPATRFSVSDSVILSLLIFVGFTVAELCFKPGRRYLRKWFGSQSLCGVIILWVSTVILTAIQNHIALADRPHNIAIALAPIIAIGGCLLAMLISALNCYLLLDDAIQEGEDLDTIDKYV